MATQYGSDPFPARPELEFWASVDGSQPQDRNLIAAYARHREAARLEPGKPEHRYRLGLTALAMEDPLLAEGHLLEATRIDPSFVPAHQALARFYRTTGVSAAALHHGSTALSLEPRSPLVVAEHAMGLLSSGRAEDAWALVERWLARPRPDPWVNGVAAHVAPHVGHEEQALAGVLRVLSGSSESRDANELRFLHHAAAMLLDRAGRYDEAFAHARQSNEAGRTMFRPFDPPAFSRWVSEKIAYFTRERARALPHATHGDRRPLFIVGMPRSGTSLLEQILASHPAVHARGELTQLSRIADRLHAQAPALEPYPRCLEQLSLRQVDALASDYRTALEPVPAGKTRVTDKMPHNFQHLELAALLVPECRVVHCVRDARDTCLSCYFTDFVCGNEYKFDLNHLAAFYRDYRRLMAHWEQVLAVPILRLRYEDLVCHTEREVRRLLDFLRLPWDERCLRFHENERPVLTASHEQVRRPMYTSSIGRWKHYERHIGATWDGLGNEG